tara:strand:+ start:252 stop:626 length:375 start_codon:yes stop_codon:yes gene_type:complete
MDKPEIMKERILAHGENLLLAYPWAKEQDPIKLCKKLRRLEVKAHSASTDYCNGFMDWEQWEEIGLDIASKLIALLNPKDLNEFHVNGDPRGYALKIESESVKERKLEIERDWGGYGILAPDFS